MKQSSRLVVDRKKKCSQHPAIATGITGQKALLVFRTTVTKIAAGISNAAAQSNAPPNPPVGSG